MPGESPERDWNALLSPPSVGEQIREMRDRRRRKRVMLAARVMFIVVIAATIWLWLGLLGRVITVPWPWSLLAVLVWVAAGGIAGAAVSFMGYRLLRAVLPSRYWELDQED